MARRANAADAAEKSFVAMTRSSRLVMVTPARLERTTPGLGILCSILLSYGATPGEIPKSASHAYPAGARPDLVQSSQAETAWTRRRLDASSPNGATSHFQPRSALGMGRPCSRSIFSRIVPLSSVTR